MPNHCETDLYISGPKEEIDRMFELVGLDNKEDPKFDFSKIIPFPDHMQNGYEWCVANWGTKWNAYDVLFRNYDNHIIVTFQTPWRPPIPVLLRLHVLFPLLTFNVEYFEHGVECAGGFTLYSKLEHYEDTEWKVGVKTHEWEAKYKGCRGG